MHIKIAIITIGISVAMFAFPVATSAQTVTPAKGAAQREANLTRLNTACTNAINQRLSSLNSTNTRVNSLVKLSSTQKQQYSEEIATDISGLQGVQTKCMNDFNANNVQFLRADYQSIFTQYRIYAEFLPQMHLLAASDTMSVTAVKLSGLATKLQIRIQSAGNLNNLTSLLSDMQTKISDANSQYSTVESQVEPFTPQSYDSNPSGTKATFQSARSDIQTGASDLKTALSDAKQIIQSLKSSNAPTPTP